MTKKVCIIGPCVNMGGIERASSVMANEIHAQGHQVMYLAIFRHPRFFEISPDILFDEPLDGSNVTSLNITKTIWRIRKRIAAFNPDTILVYNKFYASLALIALTGTGRKIFISERSSPFYHWPAKIRFINKLALLLNRPSGVIAQTEIAAKYQSKALPGSVPIAVIPNAIREVRLYPEIARQNQILAVGRLGDRLKGFDRLIKAFAQLPDHNWELVFAGGDEEGSELRQLARSYGVFEKVRFLGKVADIDKVYAGAGMFVIPSRSEGFPNALCEAMAAGLPCIAFDFVAGPADIIVNGKNGMLVKDGDIAALSRTMSELINNESQRMSLGQNAMQISDTLNSAKVASQVLDFILS